MDEALIKPLRIANAQGFWGDSIDAASDLLAAEPELDYITMDYLSEVSLSIMAIQREKDPQSCYAKDFIATIESLIPFWKENSKVKIIANAGGLNPTGCAAACRQVLDNAGLTHLNIGILEGDDLLEILRKNPENPHFTNLDTAQPLSSIIDSLSTANAYMGAEPLAALLKANVDIAITGRLADPSLTVAPCIAHYDWKLTEYQKIAQATVAGHLIECGTQVSGGISNDWMNIHDKVLIGYPIIEMSKDGTFVITKPKNSGGIVNTRTITEQLVYEIGDPSAYLSPDVSVSFLGLQLEEIGPDRVRITGAIGSPPPPTYKVSATYYAGWRADAMLSIYGRQAKLKAQIAGELIFDRLRYRGHLPSRYLIECIGESSEGELIECMLHAAAADSDKKVIERFAKEIAPLVTNGPPGTSGYTTGRPHPRQMFGYWPCLIERKLVTPRLSIWEGGVPKAVLL